MKKENPKVRILRSSEGHFLGAYPFQFPYQMPSKYPCEDAFLHGSVASANDCTGIAVTIPQTEEEAESLMDIRDVPVTSVDGDSHIPN
ncbi:MAG: hypothetical protein IKU61_05135 [Clostridia bacterium]|nr:hypothetical protein [Clostridia bacterium]